MTWSMGYGISKFEPQAAAWGVSMTEEEFKGKAVELVKRIVDAIADKEYAKLASLAQTDLSWCSYHESERTQKAGGISELPYDELRQKQKEAFLGFGAWLDEQLAVWEEDEGRKFKIDRFDEACLEEIKLGDDNTSFTAYRPTNSGEELDLWFEFDFKINKAGQIIVKFNVNN